MMVRVAKRGPNAGNQFWGCTKYPTCKGTRPFDQGSSVDGAQSPPPTVGGVADSGIPIVWSDAASRAGWGVEYTTIGAYPGFARDHLVPDEYSLARALSQTALLFDRRRDQAPTDAARLLGTLLSKLLQRGRTPLPTLNVEKASLKAHGLIDWIQELPAADPEIGIELSRGFAGKVTSDSIVSMLTTRGPFALDEDFEFRGPSPSSLFDSELESKFLTRWVPEHLGPAAGHWFTPQASLDRLLEAHNIDEAGARRIDFLFAHPAALPLAIEIDGPEHLENVSVDDDRDSKLASIGIKVVRVPNAELLAGWGPHLDDIKSHCAMVLSVRSLAPAEKGLIQAVLDCSAGAKIQLAVARALLFGWLNDTAAWSVHVQGAPPVATAAVVDVLDLASALETLYGLSLTPQKVSIQTEAGVACYSRGQDGIWTSAVDQSTPHTSALHIAVEPHLSPFHRLNPGIANQSPAIVIRSTYLPIDFSLETVAERRPVCVASLPQAEPALQTVLQHVFRKRRFRESQARSIVNALKQIDTIVLLPTGAGKSLVYQLAGLLMPGITLVIDPIVALIEDQVEGMRQYGIDRAAAVTSAVVSQGTLRRLLRGIERGEYHFVLHSPERLQSPEFRQALRAVAQSSVVNLAVVDEAHCVSEWGHDFRPAYLNVGRNLRDFGRDKFGQSPALLALTGTASRAVLRDVLTELQIDRSNSEAMIRPASFDRAELRFGITRCERDGDVNAALRGLVLSLPSKFSVPRATFFQAAGRSTASGIVFVPFVNGRSHGIMSAINEVRSATQSDTTYYSGKAPKGLESNWEFHKRANVRKFKSNQSPILVSTKAFGMGIDKPNIRYTVHVGMPGSLEAFYQEAGRAGRDRKVAHCAVVFAEQDAGRTDWLLDSAVDVNALRQRYDTVRSDRGSGDDVTRALWFHLNAFTGQDREVEQVEDVLDLLPPLDRNLTVRVPFADGDDSKEREKAIYRLVKVGVVADYEVMYGSRVYSVYLKPFDLNQCKRVFLDYVHMAQPGRALTIAHQLDSISPAEPKEAARWLAEVLIDFTYDVVERSRRRAIHEAILLARNGEDDRRIRRRLLDYLQEGVGAEQFQELLERSEVQLAPWREIADQIHTPMEAGEIRGLVIRALESFPDHPGALLLRAVTEMMCSDSDDTITAQALRMAFRSAQQRYSVGSQDIVQTIEWLAVRASTRNRALCLPLSFAIFETITDQVWSTPMCEVARGWLDELDDDSVALTETVFGFEAITHKLRAGNELALRGLDGLGRQR